MANPTIIGDGLHVGGVTTAMEARQVDSGLWARNGGSVGTPVARTGIVYSGVSNLLVGNGASAPMTISVAPLYFVGAKASGEGVYRGVLQVASTVDVAAAPGSNSRIDIVWVMQQDATGGITSPDATTQGALGVTTGTPGVTPSKPTSSMPIGAVEIGTITVPAGATTTFGCTVATTARWTAPFGTPIAIRNVTERNDITAPYDGLEVYRLDTHVIERYNSGLSTWVGGLWESSYRTWSTTWACSISGTPAVGSGGSLTMRYATRGNIIDIDLVLVVGSSGFNGGAGAWSFTLPVVAATTSYLSCKAWVPLLGGTAGNFPGFAVVNGGTNILRPYLPASSTDFRCSPAQNSTGSGGTGVPVVPASSTWTTQGDLYIFGRYAI